MEQDNQIIQIELDKVQQQKNQVRTILKEDMMKQSEGIKQKIAMRSRRKHARSA